MTSNDLPHGMIAKDRTKLNEDCFDYFMIWVSIARERWPEEVVAYTVKWLAKQLEGIEE